MTKTKKTILSDEPADPYAKAVLRAQAATDHLPPTQRDLAFNHVLREILETMRPPQVQPWWTKTTTWNTP